MDETRLDPDELLRVIHHEERRKGRGHLCIFFGYAAGVGKTYAMLTAAHAAKRQGIDVVVGYVEPHMRPQTTALLEGLEALPVKDCPHHNITLREFDLDAALKRKPGLILVDELAHTNADGCRHKKRYQDVEELLAAGIDVYTTVNVQHIESLNNMVASITGVIVQERIPDKVFDSADQVKLVDIEPQELLDRLSEGKIYREAQAQRAATNFFSIENLTALREIALRRCADRVNQLSENARIKSKGDYYTDEHILVCLSPSPSNAKLIRTAARMARAFNGSFTALFVETPAFPTMSDEDKNRLRNNIHLAEQLGATIETTYGDDVALQIAEFARLSGVSKIVIGRNNAQKRFLFSKPTLTEKLIAYSPNLDVYVIPDSTARIYRERERRHRERQKLLPADILKTLFVLAAATFIGFGFQMLGFSESNIITVYILSVLITSVITSRRIYSLASSLVGVLIFNFFFTAPHYSLMAYDSGYPATFVIMFLSAFISSSLAVRIQKNARQSAVAAYRTKILLDTNQMLQKAGGKADIVQVTAGQLMKLLHRDIVFYLAERDRLGEPDVFMDGAGAPDPAYISENEKAVAAWVLKNNKRAGATTATLGDAKCYYLAVRVAGTVYGVAGIVVGETPLDAFENNIVLSILGECALALESEQMAVEKEEAAVLAKNEQLRANLLRAISHDLRTPLTSISGNASNLLANEESFDKATRHQIYRDIYNDSLWLINLVENLLSVTRITKGEIQLHLTAELMDEVVAEALRHVGRQSAEHTIRVISSDDLILAKIDAKLMVQVVINIVDNAIKYTPPGSTITISTEKRQDKVVVKIADDGPGVPDEAKPRIFDMFYTGAGKIADSRRSLGLGLALCKSIIDAHGGTLSVSDNKPHGAVFTFTLQAEEVDLHE